MTARLPMIRVPEPAGPQDSGPWRVLNDNFRRIQDLLERAMTDGELVADATITEAMLTAAAKALVGDVTGTIGSSGSTTVEKLRGNNLPDPGASEDGQAPVYDDGTSAFVWTDLYSDPLTTRGDLLLRDASSSTRLPIGAANTILTSDATDAAWGTLTALLDAAIGSTRGAVLYRGASGWSILVPDTAGHVLTDGGVGADPSWTEPSAGGTAGVDFDLLTDEDGLILDDGAVIWT